MESSGMLRRVALVFFYNNISTPCYEILLQEWSVAHSLRKWRMISEYEGRLESHDEVRYVAKNGVFCDVTPCGSCKNRRFGGT
jgi:hypothetical protein